MYRGDLKKGRLVFITTSLIACVAGAGFFKAKKEISRTRAFPSHGVKKSYNTDISGHCFFLLQPGKKKASNNKQNNKQSSKKVEKEKEEDGGVIGANLKGMVVMCVVMMLMMFAVHCTWVTSNAYSSPSVVLASTNYDG